MDRLMSMLSADLDAAYATGGEDGFWRGFSAGVNAMRRACDGEDVSLDIPEDFKPLGHRYYPTDHSNEGS